MFVENSEYLTFFEKNKLQKKIDKLARKYRDKTIIIYGIGKAFDMMYEHYDFSKLNIIGFSDIKFKNGGEYKGLSTYDAYTFMEQKPDVVLIGALGIENILDFFEKDLMPKYGNFKVDSIIDVSIWQLFRILIS